MYIHIHVHGMYSVACFTTVSHEFGHGRINRPMFFAPFVKRGDWQEGICRLLWDCLSFIKVSKLNDGSRATETHTAL
jgi:hypothetical protein